jgi:hypothetical protein
MALVGVMAMFAIGQYFLLLLVLSFCAWKAYYQRWQFLILLPLSGVLVASGCCAPQII